MRAHTGAEWLYRCSIGMVLALSLAFSAWQVGGLILRNSQISQEIWIVQTAVIWAISTDFFLKFVWMAYIYDIGGDAFTVFFQIVSAGLPLLFSLLLFMRRRAAVWLWPIILGCWVLGYFVMMMAAGFQANEITEEQIMVEALFRYGLILWSLAFFVLIYLARLRVLQ